MNAPMAVSSPAGCRQAKRRSDLRGQPRPLAGALARHPAPFRPFPLAALPGRRGRCEEPGDALAVRGQTMEMPPIGIGWNPYRYRLFVLVEEACFASHMLAWKQFLRLRPRARADPRGRFGAVRDVRGGGKRAAGERPGARHRQARRHLSAGRSAGRAGALDSAPSSWCVRSGHARGRRPTSSRARQPSG